MAEEEKSRCENCIIRQMNSFKSLSKDELKMMSDSKKSYKIKKGKAIFKEGERLKGVFCVRNGISKLSKSNENGRDQIVKLASKGEVLGQRSVIASESTNLSAIAIDDMEVCFIPREHIEQSLKTNPNFTSDVLKHMASELRFADDVMINMAQKSVRQRLAQTLLYLKSNFGTDDEGYLLVVLSRNDFANVIGTATELCIRTLANFVKEGLVQKNGKRIKIKDQQKLQAMVDGLVS